MVKLRYRSLLGTLAIICLLSSCSQTEWETIAIDGTSTKFDLPGPIKQTEDEKGMNYAAKCGKVLYKVGVWPRKNADADRARGYTDEYVLQAFANGTLDQIRQSLVGRKPDVVFDGPIDGESGKGQQYTVKVGNRTVVNRFYLTDANIYYVEVSMDDPEDEDAHRFLDSFQI